MSSNVVTNKQLMLKLTHHCHSLGCNVTEWVGASEPSQAQHKIYEQLLPHLIAEVPWLETMRQPTPFSLSYEDLNLVWIIFLLLVKGVFDSLFTMDRTVCKHGVYYVFNHRYHQFPQSKSNFIGYFTYNMIFRFISASPCKKLKYWTTSQITTDYNVNVLFETRQWIYMRNTYQSVEQLIQ